MIGSRVFLSIYRFLGTYLLNIFCKYSKCENVALSIQEVAKGTLDQSEQLSGITNILNQSADNLDQSARVGEAGKGFAVSKEVSAFSEELNAMSNQIQQTSKNLTNMPETMNENISVFKVNES